jgi:hypothetical protein
MNTIVCSLQAMKVESGAQNFAAATITLHLAPCLLKSTTTTPERPLKLGILLI